MPRTLLTITVVMLVAALTWLAYSPGFSSALQFDDPPNLSGVAAIHSDLDALSFITEGQSGPLGRPLALATFVAQKQYWPDNLENLFQTNVVLHVGGGIAVFFLALGLTVALKRPSALPIALLTATFWLLSPFLASTPLLLVQRMTVLAGLFVFSGLAAYVWGRILHNRSHPLGIWLALSGLLLGTSLGALSKENAVLLPLLALVIELTILRHSLPTRSRVLRLTQISLIGVPALLVVVYLGTRIPDLFSGSGHRAFTPLERLASQPQILLEYLRHLLFPTTASVTPFTDDRGAVMGWMTLVSGAAWVGALGVAVGIKRWSPIPLFGLLFFLTGHVLESTIIYLELYFAHRNYVPSFGLYFALAAGLGYAAQLRPKIFIPGIVGYVLLFAAVLVSATSFWGQPRLAAELWSVQHPDSVRAQQFLARQYAQMGDYSTAQNVLKRGAGSDDSGSMLVQALQTCVFSGSNESVVRNLVQQAAAEIRAGRGNNSLGLIILDLTVQVLDGDCTELLVEDLNVLIQAVLLNPVYQHNRPVQIRILNAKALIAQAQGDWETATKYIRDMYDLTQHANHARVYSELLVIQDRREEALEFLREARLDTPSNFLRIWIRDRMINRQITAIETSAQIQKP